MAVWHLVVAYLIVFVILQLAVYRYLRNEDETRPARFRSPNADSGVVEDHHAEESGRSFTTSDESSNEPDVTRETPVTNDLATTDGNASNTQSSQTNQHATGNRFCPECGAQNESEPVFSYCRNCASPLG